jgi:hypothetical protein
MPFTCQVTKGFVPPETFAKNVAVCSTFTEAVAGKIVTVIPVTGFVHELVEAVVDVATAVVVHVMAVLGAAYLWHDTRVNTPISNAKTGRRLTAPLSSTSHMPIHRGLAATSLPKSAYYIS